jgi:hypothetical protein
MSVNIIKENINTCVLSTDQRAAAQAKKEWLKNSEWKLVGGRWMRVAIHKKVGVIFAKPTARQKRMSEEERTVEQEIAGQITSGQIFLTKEAQEKS